MKQLVILASLPFLLTGCMKHYDSYEVYMQARALPSEVTVKSFPHCSDYDCATVHLANFWPREWARVEQQFKPRAQNAATERQQIADAIMVMEQIIGPITGTADDVGDTFVKTGKGQLDCVDESTNTSTYLYLLQQEGLMRLHTLAAPQARAPFLKWPHQTAVIVDEKTGEAYAVDSWFDDNGKPIHILPLDIWKDGWQPPQGGE